MPLLSNNAIVVRASAGSFRGPASKHSRVVSSFQSVSSLCEYRHIPIPSYHIVYVPACHVTSSTVIIRKIDTSLLERYGMFLSAKTGGTWRATNATKQSSVQMAAAYAPTPNAMIARPLQGKLVSQAYQVCIYQTSLMTNFFSWSHRYCLPMTVAEPGPLLDATEDRPTVNLVFFGEAAEQLVGSPLDHLLPPDTFPRDPPPARVMSIQGTTVHARVSVSRRSLDDDDDAVITFQVNRLLNISPPIAHPTTSTG